MNVDEIIAKNSEMTKSERDFVRKLILEYKPKKILEVGIAAGSTSAIILDTIKTMDSHLYSVDLNTVHYKFKNKKSGFVVDSFPELKSKWSLKTGKIVCNFLQEIGNDIDLCILDTVHSNPGEFLDFLQVLPYLKKDAIVIIHDINYHVHFSHPHSFTCGNLFSVISGQKILPETIEYEFFPNIGACKLSENSINNIFDVFNCLTLPWAYVIPQNQYQELINHFSKHYDQKLVDFFVHAFEYNNNLLKNKKQNKLSLSDCMDKFKKTFSCIKCV